MKKRRCYNTVRVRGIRRQCKNCAQLRSDFCWRHSAFYAPKPAKILRVSAV